MYPGREKKDMKKISILVPCYNEEKSILKLYNTITELFCNELHEKYNYEIVFLDDYSIDATRSILKEICENDAMHTKAVFNAANFGLLRNVFDGFRYVSGDATFLVFGDMQDPIELLPSFLELWENGHKVVTGEKIHSDENKIMFAIRKLYYRVIDTLSETKQIKQFTGFGLYDSSFVDVINQIEDVKPYLKQVVAEYAPDHAIIEYCQNKSERGKSNYNFYKNYDFAMEGITSSTKKLLRLSTFLGTLLGVFSAVYASSVIIKKLILWDQYPFGTAAITVGVFMLGAMQLFFIGILGEYVLSINTRSTRKPRTAVSELINFEKKDN